MNITTFLSIFFLFLAIYFYGSFKSNLKKGNKGDEAITIEKVRIQLLLSTVSLNIALILWNFHSGILNMPIMASIL